MLITTREDLQELEVLVLEIIPSAEYKNDEDILKAYLTKWFREMGLLKIILPVIIPTYLNIPGKK